MSAGASTPINLTNFTTGTRIDLPYGAEKLSVSPLGILYTSSSGRITEYNPDTLAVVATLPVVGNPSPLKFSPDGSRAFFLNTTPQIGARTVQSFRTAQRDLTEWPAFSFTSSAPVFEDLLVASNDRIFAYERANQSLWEITASPLGGQVTNLNGSIVGNQVYGVALSNEVPSARFLYVLTQGSSQPSLRRINLSDFPVVAKLAAASAAKATDTPKRDNVTRVDFMMNAVIRMPSRSGTGSVESGLRPSA